MYASAPSNFTPFANKQSHLRIQFYSHETQSVHHTCSKSCINKAEVRSFASLSHWRSAFDRQLTALSFKTLLIVLSLGPESSDTTADTCTLLTTQVGFIWRHALKATVAWCFTWSKLFYRWVRMQPHLGCSFVLKCTRLLYAPDRAQGHCIYRNLTWCIRSLIIAVMCFIYFKGSLILSLFPSRFHISLFKFLLLSLIVSLFLFIFLFQNFRLLYTAVHVKSYVVLDVYLSRYSRTATHIFPRPIAHVLIEMVEM